MAILGLPYTDEELLVLQNLLLAYLLPLCGVTGSSEQRSQHLSPLLLWLMGWTKILEWQKDLSISGWRAYWAFAVWLVVVQSLPGWVALVLMPKSDRARGFAVFMAMLAGVVYISLMLTSMYEGTLDEFGLDTFLTLDGLAKMFSMKEVVLAGWIHYVSFDLMAGVWICQDAAKRDVPYLVLPPCLFFCMMLGPTGLVMYLILRLPFGKAPAKEKNA